MCIQKIKQYAAQTAGRIATRMLQCGVRMRELHQEWARPSIRVRLVLDMHSHISWELMSTSSSHLQAWRTFMLPAHKTLWRWLYWFRTTAALPSQFLVDPLLDGSLSALACCSLYAAGQPRTAVTEWTNLTGPCHCPIIPAT